MSPTDPGPAGGGDVPSMLDLVRLSPRALFPPGGRELYRQIALLTEMRPGSEVAVVGCGAGVTLEYFVREHGAHGFGVDFDAALIERARDRLRTAELEEDLHVEQSALDDLPFRNAQFDVVLGELGVTAHARPEEAVEELVRVTKPGGRIALIQLVWKAPVAAERRDVLSAHLGVRPLMLVEWRRLLRGQGIERLHTEDWSDEETAFRPQITKPFPDFAELFTFTEKLGILRRAWQRWGLAGVRTALAREAEVHRLLTRERILGLDLLMGLKPTADDESGVVTVGHPPEGSVAEHLGPQAPEDDKDPSTQGLPLFTPKENDA